MTEISNQELLRIELANLDATQALGHRLGALLQAGDVVALIGPLGAGKTHLTRSIAEGMQILPGQQVCSPTFVLMHIYQARLPIYHFDAYRLHGEAEFEDLGVQEYLEGDGVCLIEWADKVPGSLPIDHLRVELVHTGETSRRVTLRGFGMRGWRVIRGLAAIQK